MRGLTFIRNERLHLIVHSLCVFLSRTQAVHCLVECKCANSLDQYFFSCNGTVGTGGVSLSTWLLLFSRGMLSDYSCSFSATHGKQFQGPDSSFVMCPDLGTLFKDCHIMLMYSQII